MTIYPLAMLLALFLSIPGLVYPQGSKIIIEKAPDWVDPLRFDSDANPPAGQEEGYYYLLIDEQENAISQERYQHYVYKVLTTEGVQEMSDLSFEYDPAYQKLILHQVSVHRGGKIINQLPRDIKPIQREQSMDRYLYDGSLTAVINLKDIRVNDVIEYAFTRKGYNPVFNGHFSKKIYFNFSLPYEKLFHRLVVPPSLPLDFEYRNADVKPLTKRSGLNKEYIWTFNHVNGLIMDDNLPDWYDGNQYVMITDLGNWGEVAAWATKHFETTPGEQQQLKDKIGSKFTGDDDESYALAAIRFVQDEVRYLGFESGLNSHKPHSPPEVFDQRFGDCKDKSLLLCEILRLNNIEACPVLANTVLREKITNESPSLSAFNHCIVQLKLGGKYYYIDPTINNQGGSLESNSFPTYGKGLVVKAGSADLIDFPGPVPSEISEEQTFHLADLDGEAMLTVRTTYSGLEADYIRSYFLSNSAESIQKNYLTFYGNLYPDIAMSVPLTKQDDRNGNIFSVEEHYRIPAFWKQKEGGEEMVSQVYAQTLESYFNVAKSSQRKTPYRLAYPVSYHHYIHVEVPVEWNLVPADKLIETDYYQYEHLARYENKEVTLQTHYETKQDFVPPDAFDRFAADHQEMMNNLTFQLSFNKDLVYNEKGISWMAIVTALVSLAFGIWLVLRLFYYYDPQPLSALREGLPIGGWLILPAIGLCISPFRIVYDLFNMPQVYDSQMWANLLALKRYGLFGFVFVEHVYNMVLVPFTILIVVLFFKRRSSLPRIISIYFAVRCVVAVADVVAVGHVDTADASFYRNMVQGIVAAAVWIPYFNVSTRVKETFVKRINDDDGDGYAEVGAGLRESWDRQTYR